MTGLKYHFIIPDIQIYTCHLGDSLLFYNCVKKYKL